MASRAQKGGGRSATGVADMPGHQSGSLFRLRHRHALGLAEEIRVIDYDDLLHTNGRATPRTWGRRPLAWARRSETGIVIALSESVEKKLLSPRGTFLLSREVAFLSFCAGGARLNLCR